MKEHILREIKRLAEDSDGTPPGRTKFESVTGIKRGEWYGKFWAKWSDALTEAGYSPNQRQEKAPKETLLDEYAMACKSLGRVPSEGEFRIYSNEHGFHSHSTFHACFGGWKQAQAELRRRALAQGDEDLVKILPEAQEAPPLHDDKVPPKAIDGWVYLLQSGSHFKIGRSDELERRVKQISIALPEKVTLVHAIRTDDPPGIESYWHRRFAAQRSNGEWFQLSPADVKAFKRRNFQ